MEFTLLVIKSVFVLLGLAVYLCPILFAVMYFWKGQLWGEPISFNYVVFPMLVGFFLMSISFINILSM